MRSPLIISYCLEILSTTSRNFNHQPRDSVRRDPKVAEYIVTGEVASPGVTFIPVGINTLFFSPADTDYIILTITFGIAI